MRNQLAVSITIGILLLFSNFNHVQSQHENNTTNYLEDNANLSIILEASLITNSNHGLNGQPNSIFTPNLSRITDYPNQSYEHHKGFSASVKIAKTIDSQIFESDISIDLIGGIKYKEINTLLDGLSDHNTWGTRCFGYPPTEIYSTIFSFRSIEVPFELRTNFSFGNWIASPSIGLGVEVPVKIGSTTYAVDTLANNNLGNIITNNEFTQEKFLNLNSTIKFELAYQLPNNQKIRFGASHNRYLENKFTREKSPFNGISNQAIQLSYEIPISSLGKPRCSKLKP